MGTEPKTRPERTVAVEPGAAESEEAVANDDHGVVHRTALSRGGAAVRHLPVTGAATVSPGNNGHNLLAPNSGHTVLFYDSDTYLAGVVAASCQDAFASGVVAVVIATAAHRELLEDTLRQWGWNLDALTAEGRYVALDAAETLTTLMRDEAPDAARFTRLVNELVTAAAEHRRDVWIFGEMVGLLALAGNDAAVVSLEELWHEAQGRHGLALLCAYPIRDLGGETRAGLVEALCAAHTHVVPAESFSILTTDDDRLSAIVALQQKERSLQLEIAARKRIEVRLQEALAAEHLARHEAEAALALRDEFLATAAHELRNPLAVILGRAQLVRRRLRREGEVQPVAADQAMESIAAQVDRLVQLLNRMLDVSRLEHGRVSLDHQSIDIAALCRRVVANANVSRGRHAIALDAPAMISATVDPLRIEQLLANLLDNASRYGPDDRPIEVELRQAPSDAIALSVRDYGPGIPLDIRTRIIERYAHARANGSGGGMGLGLFICREVVDLHGGTIGAEAPADGGTRIVVRLPVQPAMPCAESEAIRRSA